MADELTIPVRRLREVAAALLDGLEQNGVEEVRIDKDYFWAVPPENRFDVYADPGPLTIGQVTDSWRQAQQLADEKSGVIPYALVWLADVLAAAGHRTSAAR